MVAMTSGRTPWLSIGSTISFLNISPSVTIDMATPTSTAAQNGRPKNPMPISTKNAGSMTNSP